MRYYIIKILMMLLLNKGVRTFFRGGADNGTKVCATKNKDVD